MPKQKIKYGRKKLFYLEEETIREIKRNAAIQNLSESSYIDFMIKKIKLNSNPTIKIKEIQSEKEVLQEKLKEIEKREKAAINEMETLHNWQEEKRTQKPKAIQILQRKILLKEFNDVEEIAKNWSLALGISPIELISEAQSNIKKGI